MQSALAYIRATFDLALVHDEFRGFFKIVLIFCFVFISVFEFFAVFI